MEELAREIVSKWSKENKINRELSESIIKDLSSYLQTTFEAGAEEADEDAYENGWNDAVEQYEEEEENEDFLMKNS